MIVAARRAAAAVRLRAAVIRHRGDSVCCPLCGHTFDRFKDDANRPNALCWRCGSQERHRAQWLLFEQRPQLLGRARSLLHFAPERCLRRRLRVLPGQRCVTADLDGAGVDLRLLYAPDIAGRLSGAGFDVEVVDMHAQLGEQARRYRLLESDLAFLCRC